MSKFDDLTGRQFNRWYVESFYGNHTKPSGFKVKLWNCTCLCGTKKVVAAPSLRNGDSQSCGCLNKELIKERNQTHNRSKSREYEAWRSMKKRCLNPNDKNYVHYGGRGIKVCDRWSNSFENFYEDMGDKPDNHSLDRKDVNGNYEPNNCRWATQDEQIRNRRNSIMVSYKGEVSILKDFCKSHNLNYGTILSRINKYNMTLSEALKKSGIII